MSLSVQPVAYWRLDESSGNAADATGGGFTLTNNNTCTYGAAQRNNGVSFSAGSSQRLRSTASILSGSPAKVSLSFWGTRSSVAQVVPVSFGTGLNDVLGVAWYSDTQCYFYVCGGASRTFGKVTLSGTGT